LNNRLNLLHKSGEATNPGRSRLAARTKNTPKGTTGLQHGRKEDRHDIRLESVTMAAARRARRYFEALATGGDVTRDGAVANSLPATGVVLADGVIPLVIRPYRMVRKSGHRFSEKNPAQTVS
jgi:hypothetical protein